MPLPPVTITWIFLRGLTRGTGHWGLFVGLFEQSIPGSRVIALDFPGNGQLNRLTSPMRVQDMVAHCRAQLAALQIDPPYRLLAMSLGAMVAVDWAQRFPEEIAGSVLINTSLRPYSAFYQRLRPRNYITLLKLVMPGASDEAWERAILQLTSRHEREAVLSHWIGLRREFPVTARNALSQLIAAARFQAPHMRPLPPCLLLVSELDGLVSSACSASIAWHWQCDMRVHPSAGHDLPLDDGPWVIEQVQHWLARSGQR